MKSLLSISYVRFLSVLLVIGTVGVILTSLVSAQQNPQTVTISGTLDAITANGTIIVDGQTYSLASGAPLPSSALLGLNVTITGQVDPATQTVVIISITITSSEATPEITPEVTATPAPEQTPDPEATDDPDDDDDDDIIIIIEGPVKKINLNIITIYNIDIELSPDDPNLTVIQIGDVIRVSGKLKKHDSPTIVIIAVTIIFVNVDVVVQGDQVWRDDSGCGNPPPPWAPAHGWRRRCERGGGGEGSGKGKAKGEGSGS